MYVDKSYISAAGLNSKNTIILQHKEKAQRRSLIVKPQREMDHVILRHPIDDVMYGADVMVMVTNAAFHSSRELVFTRSRDPGNHEFTTCQWNAF